MQKVVRYDKREANKMHNPIHEARSHRSDRSADQSDGEEFES